MFNLNDVEGQAWCNSAISEVRVIRPDYLATVITGVNLIPFRVVSETGEYS